MIEKDGMKIRYNNVISNNKEKFQDFDDLTFNLWKTELKKELPYFWELMIKF